MEALQSPDIVFSLAGHDKGGAFIVLKAEDGEALLVNGKTRKLENPKRKSLKHIGFGKPGKPELAAALAAGKATDRLIRKELAIYRSEVGIRRENPLVKR